MKFKIVTSLFFLINISISSQTLDQAGISETAQNFIRNSGFENQIINDERLQYCLNGIIFSEPAPTGANSITTVNQLLNDITAGTIASPNTYFIDGDFQLNASQTIEVPSNVTIYVRGRIIKIGSHTTLAPGTTNLTPENSVEHIFDINNSNNVKLIGIDNPLIESNPEGDEYNRATGFYLNGNTNNVEIRGFHIKNVWEGVNCRFGVDRVLIRNNYIQNTNKRAIWILGANETTAVHNFIENAGWDGFDWDAFAGSRDPDTSGNLDTSNNAIGAPVSVPNGNLGNTGFENFVLGSGRFMGFVEEGTRDTFAVNNIGFMANFQPPNPIRLGFQLGWANNASSEDFFNSTNLRTEDNAFITNVIYRPEAYNVEQRAGRVNGGGDYFATDRGATPTRIGITFFYDNEAFGNLPNGTPIGKSSDPNFLISVECEDFIPTNMSSFDNRYADFNPQTRIQALKDQFRIGTTTTLIPEGPTTPPTPGGSTSDCSTPPTGLTFVSSTNTSVTFSFDNDPSDTRTFELRAYAPNTFTGGNVNTGTMGFASAVAGSTSITINFQAVDSGKTFDFAMRAICSGQTPNTSQAGNIVEDIILEDSTLNILDFQKTIQNKTRIYPNPSKDLVFVDSDFEFSTITVYDLIGRKIDSYKNVSSINISHLNNGIYFIQLEESKSNQVITKQVIKQ